MSIIQISCRHCGFGGTVNVVSLRDEANAVEFMRGTMCHCSLSVPVSLEKRKARILRLTRPVNRDEKAPT